MVGERIPEALLPALSELMPANSDIASELHKIHHSPKLVALQEIMEECGIGVDASSSDSSLTVGQHRVLIFAQHKVMAFLSSLFFYEILSLCVYIRISVYICIVCDLDFRAGPLGHH